METKIKELFTVYFVRLTTFSYSYVKSLEVSKDVVQEAFVVLSQNEEIFDKPDLVIKSFLYSTVRNISLNYIKREKIRKQFQRNNSYTDFYNPDYLETIIRAEVIGEVYEELSKLSDKAEHIVRLIYLDHNSYAEVANELGISINTVKTHRLRALNYLRSKFLIILFIFYLIISQ